MATVHQASPIPTLGRRQASWPTGSPRQLLLHLHPLLPQLGARVTPTRTLPATRQRKHSKQLELVAISVAATPEQVLVRATQREPVLVCLLERVLAQAPRQVSVRALVRASESEALPLLSLQYQ